LRYSRRTKRAANILETFAIELTGRLGSIISKQLHITVSSSTITRIAHGHQLMEITQPKVLGVDDWAYRKGVSYGTILIDMETSRPIDLLPSRGCGNIRRWIDFVKRSKHKLVGLKTFTRGLLRDIEAVENGINMPWSNGMVEGHVNRIKSIKRHMYWRASFELLRKKVILSQTG